MTDDDAEFSRQFEAWRKEQNEDEAVIVVCQGPPRCSLEGDAALAAQTAGCQWCERYFADGTIQKPGEA